MTGDLDTAGAVRALVTATLHYSEQRRDGDQAAAEALAEGLAEGLRAAVDLSPFLGPLSPSDVGELVNYLGRLLGDGARLTAEVVSYAAARLDVSPGELWAAFLHDR